MNRRISAESPSPYRGRIAPSPTGLLHLGHAATFLRAFERAHEAGGVLVLRNEDIDPDRSRVEFEAAFIEDLRWFGIEWREGPDVGGPLGPYRQSERTVGYREVMVRLVSAGHVYPCTCSRKDIRDAARAPHAGDGERLYSGRCRSLAGGLDRERLSDPSADLLDPALWSLKPGTRFSLRMHTPDGSAVTFVDGRCGYQSSTVGKDFGDFVLWRHDGVPSYQLACVADDHAMQITEVVRGADLLVSTARQILLYRALGWEPPAFFHCPLITDASGQRLAKRHDSLSLRSLRRAGQSPDDLCLGLPR